MTSDISVSPDAADTPDSPDGGEGATFGHIENRALRDLVAHWLTARGERVMPAIADIDPTAIPSVLGQIWLSDYAPETGRLRYRLAGEKINDFWGGNIAGKHLDEFAPPDRLAGMTDKIRMARELPAILHDRICLSLTDEITRNGERIVLPLSDDGETVTALIGAAHCDWQHDLEFDPYVACSETTTVSAL